MPKKKLSEKQLKKNYQDACKAGYCPGLAERENKRIIGLAKRLRSTSDAETLANIQEWQNNNVDYWVERYPFPRYIQFSAIIAIYFAIFFVLKHSGMLGFIFAWGLTVALTVFAVLWSFAIYMVHTRRKQPLKRALDLFKSKIPIDSLLDNKLAVCGDYAKLTASLLFNLYPEREVYFVHAPEHVATGIMVENKLYVLDKSLPVATIDQWHKKWHPRKSSDKKVEKAKGDLMEPVELNGLLSEDEPTPLDAIEMGNKLKDLVKVQSSPEDSKTYLVKLWSWNKGAILYADDDLVNYSVAQRLMSLISNEKIDIAHVKDLLVEKKNDDLLFAIKVESH